MSQLSAWNAYNRFLNQVHCLSIGEGKAQREAIVYSYSMPRTSKANYAYERLACATAS